MRDLARTIDEAAKLGPGVEGTGVAELRDALEAAIRERDEEIAWLQSELRKFMILPEDGQP